MRDEHDHKFSLRGLAYPSLLLSLKAKHECFQSLVKTFGDFEVKEVFVWSHFF